MNRSDFMKDRWSGEHREKVNDYWTPEKREEKKERMEMYWKVRKEKERRGSFRYEKGKKYTSYGRRHCVYRVKMTKGKQHGRPLYFIGIRSYKSYDKIEQKEFFNRYKIDLDIEVLRKEYEGYEISLDYFRSYEKLKDAKNRFKNLVKRHNANNNRFYLNKTENAGIENISDQNPYI